MKPKNIPTPLEAMQSMVELLDEVYPAHRHKAVGTIQFHFTHTGGEPINCYIRADSEHLKLYSGQTSDPTVTLNCDFEHWLDLASKKLNPVWGAIWRKLRFKGDVSFFKTLPDLQFRADLAVQADPITSFEKSSAKHRRPNPSVLVVNASPRARNGYTELLLTHFVEGMKDAGADVEEIYLSRLNIKTCTGCWHCWTSGSGRCAFDGKDDFEMLYEKTNKADLIVYAFPLYVDGMPSRLKNCFERSVRRVHPYMHLDDGKMRHPRRVERKNQSMAIFSVCGFPERKQFKALDAHFEAISHNFHIPVVGKIYRPGVMFLFNNPLLYRQQIEILKNIRKAGFELVKNGKTNRRTERRISRKFMSHSLFADTSNWFWHDKITKHKNPDDY